MPCALLFHSIHYAFYIWCIMCVILSAVQSRIVVMPYLKYSTLSLVSMHVMYVYMRRHVRTHAYIYIYIHIIYIYICMHM